MLEIVTPSIDCEPCPAPISPPSSVIVASGSLRARKKLLEKRESCKFERFIIVVNSCTLTQSQTITIPTRTTIDPSRPLDYKLARIA
jgi:hypothetical protein